MYSTFLYTIWNFSSLSPAIFVFYHLTVLYLSLVKKPVLHMLFVQADTRKVNMKAHQSLSLL